MTDASQQGAQAAARFRKKSVEIDAWQWHGGPLMKGDPDWVAAATEPLIALGSCPQQDA